MKEIRREVGLPFANNPLGSLVSETNYTNFSGDKNCKLWIENASDLIRLNANGEIDKNGSFKGFFSDEVTKKIMIPIKAVGLDDKLFGIGLNRNTNKFLLSYAGLDSGNKLI